MMRKKKILILALLGFNLVLSGCTEDMKDQPRLDPLEKSDFFEDGRASRTWVEGTVARGQLREDDAFYTGKSGGEYVKDFPKPLEVTSELLDRGKERYDIYCTVCHDPVGTGKGMVVRRGFNQPKSFHEQRLRDIPNGYFFEVMSRGYGVMPDYASEITPQDRWAIIAYIRALQHSQNVAFENLTPIQKKHVLGKAE